MATSGFAGYVPNLRHLQVRRSIVEQIVETGDVIATAGPGRTVVAVTIDNWFIDELAAFGTDLRDREREPDKDDGPDHAYLRRQIDRKRQRACCCGLGDRVSPA
jgi:hypothetical protein